MTNDHAHQVDKALALDIYRRFRYNFLKLDKKERNAAPHLAVPIEIEEAKVASKVIHTDSKEWHFATLFFKGSRGVRRGCHNRKAQGQRDDTVPAGEAH
jgi:hypothetical protein